MQSAANRPENGTAVPPEESRELILQQLQRVLESPAFCHSKRYPRFLRFVVEQTLKGRAKSIKERSVGVDVFDRDPDYDPSIDPIVRIAGGEIRKRLAQYYLEEAHEHELRISLEPGSYVPTFHWPPPSPFAAQGVAASPAETLPPAIPSTPSTTRTRWLSIGLVASVCIVTFAASATYVIRNSDPVRQFWRPFLQSPKAPLICVGGATYAITSEYTAMRTGVNSQDYLALGDVDALHRISSTLAAMGKTLTLANADALNFGEMSEHPVILVGGSPNSWTMREMSHLPLQLAPHFAPGISGILDRSDPSRLIWSVNFRQPLAQIPQEYAVIARFHNPETGQLMLIAAGVGAKGEVSAGEFLTDPAYLKDFTDHAPRGWQDRNLEIVLEIKMVDGVSGAPHVLRTALW